MQAEESGELNLDTHDSDAQQVHPPKQPISILSLISPVPHASICR